jgi:hypothetical protein
VVRKRRTEGDTHAPLVLVHGLRPNRYAWHMPERSMVNYLRGSRLRRVQRGPARPRPLGRHGADRSRGVDDYIRGDLPAVIDRVLTLTGYKRTS